MMLPSTKKLNKESFQQIFLEHWDGFKEKYPSYGNVQYEDVLQKMLNCGKEAGGYTEYRCMHCGKGSRRVCFTCKSYFCLSCAKVYVDNFVKQVSKALHSGVIYRHVILTVPEQCRPYFYKDRHSGSLLSAFIRCGYECLEAVVRQVKSQPLKIGIIAVVQTYGRSGSYNPHLHVIMTNGGINEKAKKWVDLNYFPYEILHKKWQYYLLGMLKRSICTESMKRLVDVLWRKYPKGFVANIKKGEVPERCRGLAQYLAKYLASPPISVRRITGYDGKFVTYWYKDHKSKAIKKETVDVYTFIGRMVEHVLPKGYKRIRYYGLQATKTFSKWCEIIKNGLKRIGRMVKGVYQILSSKRYRERYMDVSHKDPMICEYCGTEMELFEIWHPKYGMIYNVLEEMKPDKYEIYDKSDQNEKVFVKSTVGPTQLSLFPLRALNAQ